MENVVRTEWEDSLLRIRSESQNHTKSHCSLFLYTQVRKFIHQRFFFSGLRAINYHERDILAPYIADQPSLSKRCNTPPSDLQDKRVPRGTFGPVGGPLMSGSAFLVSSYRAHRKKAPPIIYCLYSDLTQSSPRSSHPFSLTFLAYHRLVPTFIYISSVCTSRKLPWRHVFHHPLSLG